MYITHMPDLYAYINKNLLTQAVESLEREVRLLQNMKHDRIVRYYGTEITETSFRIFMEYMPGVSYGVNYILYCM